MEFNGFPSRMRFTPIPNPVFSSLLPQIKDTNELKVLLHVFELLYPKKGNVRFVSYDELLSHPNLAASLEGEIGEALDSALEALAVKQAIIALETEDSDLFFINDEQGRKAVELISSGEIEMPQIKPVRKFEKSSVENADIFSLYESNVGVITPLIAEELKEAQKQYPESWIRDAVKEAVDLNKRNWRYIARILERWSTEGREDGTHRGNTKADSDPDKYVKGKYGHIVRR